MLHFSIKRKKVQTLYVIYYMTWLISKLDSSKYICEKSYLSSRIVRWQVLLVEYDIVYMTRNAVKRSVIANHIAKHIVEDCELLKFDLLDKDVLTFKDNIKMNDWWTVYFDGAINVLGNETGTVLTLSLKFFPE